MVATEEELLERHEVYSSHIFDEITNYWPRRYSRTRRYKYHGNLAWRLDFPFAHLGKYQKLGYQFEQDDWQQATNYFFWLPKELYDLENDPYEVRNLAKDPGHAQAPRAAAVEIRILAVWQYRSEDPWL